MRYPFIVCLALLVVACGRAEQASIQTSSAIRTARPDLAKGSLMQNHIETYSINDTLVPKDQFVKFVDSLHDRTSESCEKRPDGGRTSFYAVDARSDRYEISHDVTYTRDSAGEVQSSKHLHEIRRLEKDSQ